MGKRSRMANPPSTAERVGACRVARSGASTTGTAPVLVVFVERLFVKQSNNNFKKCQNQSPDSERNNGQTGVGDHRQRTTKETPRRNPTLLRTCRTNSIGKHYAADQPDKSAHRRGVPTACRDEQRTRRGRRYNRCRCARLYFSSFIVFYCRAKRSFARRWSRRARRGARGQRERAPTRKQEGHWRTDRHGLLTDGDALGEWAHDAAFAAQPNKNAAKESVANCPGRGRVRLHFQQTDRKL